MATTSALKGTPSTLLGRIAARVTTLRPSEAKVARVVLERPGDVINMTLAELSSVAGVSEPTILRFATALDCDGFHQFRIKLAQSVALGVPATQSTIVSGDSVPDILSKVFDFSISSLHHTKQHLDAGRVQEAIDAIEGASQLLFIGLGASGIVAADAEQKFPLFGKPCSAPSDVHQQFLAASLSGPGTVVIAVSNSGRTRAAMDAVTIAKTCGATTIGITGSQNAFSESVDIPIIASSLDNTDVYTPTISRLAQLVVIDVLATGVMLRRSPEDAERLSEVKRRLIEVRQGTPQSADGEAEESAPTV